MEVVDLVQQIRPLHATVSASLRRMHGAHTFVDPTPIIIDPAAQYSAIANGQAQPVGNDYKGRYNVQTENAPSWANL